jgi:hypothetical protein
MGAGMARTVLCMMLTWAVVFILPQSVVGAELALTVERAEKNETASVGAQVVVTVHFKTYKPVCEEALAKTKFFAKGMTIRKATPWKKVTRYLWTRKLMLEVTGDVGNPLMITAIRRGQSDNAFAQLRLGYVGKKE